MFDEGCSFKHIFTAFLVSLFIVGCGLSGTTPVVTLPPEIIQTVAAQTLLAELTQEAGLATDTPQPSPTDSPSPTSEPTSTPQPTPTLTPSPEPSPPADPTSSPEATPSPEPTPSPLAVRDLILEDDFEQTETWASVDEDQFSFSYQDGGYQVANDFINGAASSIRSIDYRHILVEVEAEQVAGPEDAYYGVVCRWQDSQNYYGLVVGAGGFYAVIRLSDGEIAFLDHGTVNGDVFRDSGPNRIGGSCLGDRLILFVNGQRLLEVRDQTFESGYVGVVVGTRSVGGAQVHFDNFALLRP